MKSITVLFQNISKKIKKFFEKRFFLNSLPVEVIEDLEKDLHEKLSNINYSIKELLDLEEHALLMTLQNEDRLENFFVFLQEEINKRELDIDLKKYPAFKDYELKNEDKLNYLTESFNEKQQRFPISK